MPYGIPPLTVGGLSSANAEAALCRSPIKIQRIDIKMLS